MVLRQLQREGGHRRQEVGSQLGCIRPAHGALHGVLGDAPHCLAQLLQLLVLLQHEQSRSLTPARRPLPLEVEGWGRAPPLLARHGDEDRRHSSRCRCWCGCVRSAPSRCEVLSDAGQQVAARRCPHLCETRCVRRQEPRSPRAGKSRPRSRCRKHPSARGGRGPCPCSLRGRARDANRIAQLPGLLRLQEGGEVPLEERERWRRVVAQGGAPLVRHH